MIRVQKATCTSREEDVVGIDENHVDALVEYGALRMDWKKSEEDYLQAEKRVKHAFGYR